MENLKIDLNGTVVFAELSGEITLEVTQDLKAELERSMDSSDFTTLVLDMKQVSFIDSSGIGFLVSLNTRVKSMERTMYLLAPSEQVQKTLQLVQLISFFRIVEHKDELLTLLED